MLHGPNKRHNLFMAKRLHVKPTSIRTKSKGKKAYRNKLRSTKKTLRTGRCSKGQLKTALLISDLLGGASYEMEVTWDWLRNTSHANMYLDIYFPKYKLGVEFQGQQHYKFPNFFHKTKAEFNAAKKRDKLKEELLKQNDIKYIQWRYNESFNDVRGMEKLQGVGIERRKNTKPLVKRTQMSSKIRPRKKL